MKMALVEDGIPFTAFEVDDIDAEYVRLRDLVEAVDETGYEIPTQTMVLPIGGMTCASCAAHVERVRDWRRAIGSNTTWPPPITMTSKCSANRMCLHSPGATHCTGH